jgi:hypothetical protein
MNQASQLCSHLTRGVRGEFVVLVAIPPSALLAQEVKLFKPTDLVSFELPRPTFAQPWTGREERQPYSAMKLYSAEFERLVMDALEHLWEYRKLGTHSLAQLKLVNRFLPTDTMSLTHLDRGEALHRVLLYALEEMHRSTNFPDSNEARYYPVLEAEYVQRLKNRQAAQLLGFSESTFHRTRREAIRCFAQVLADLESGMN